jgi:actin related protein 2/3 complex subunit 4
MMGHFHNKPEIETGFSPEVIARPITITRTETEYVYIETSISSVRISVKVMELDNIDVLLAKMFMRFFVQRADSFRILRRKPVSGYDISFLVTNIHFEQMALSKLIEFIVAILQDVDKALSDMKVTLKARVSVQRNTLKVWCEERRKCHPSEWTIERFHTPQI